MQVWQIPRSHLLDEDVRVATMSKSEDVKRDLSEEVDLLDTMLSSLVELLEEKGIVTQNEWEKRIKERASIE